MGRSSGIGLRGLCRWQLERGGNDWRVLALPCGQLVILWRGHHVVLQRVPPGRHLLAVWHGHVGDVHRLQCHGATRS